MDGLISRLQIAHEMAGDAGMPHLAFALEGALAALAELHQPQAPTAWIRATLVETGTGEVGYLIKCGERQEHYDDVPLYRQARGRKVPLVEFRAAVQYARNACGHADYAESLQNLLDLIDSQA